MVKISNVPAYRAAIYANRYTEAASTNLERIASGKRINSAADSPSEIGYTSRVQSHILSMKRAALNVQDNISMFQAASAAISGTDGISAVLSTIRESIVSATNATLTSADRATIQSEIEVMIEEINSLTTSTEFNTRKLLNGDMVATVTSNREDLKGYATDQLSTNTYSMTTIVGASAYQASSNNSAVATITSTASLLEHTENLGEYGGDIDDTGFAVSEDLDIIFTSTAAYTVYSSGGTYLGAGTITGITTLDGGETLDFSTSAGTFAEGYKLVYTTTAGGGTGVVNEGNAGAFNSADAGALSLTGAMDTNFVVKYDYDGSKLSYAVYDSDDNRISNWESAGSTLQTYSSSALGESTFSLNVTGARRGDQFQLDFSEYSSVSSAGGSFILEGNGSSVTIAYDGDDKLSDIASRINSTATGIATATVRYSSGTDGPELYVTSVNKGENYSIRLSDVSGNLIDTLSMSKVSGTGTDASFYLNGATHNSSDGRFESAVVGMIIEVADGASESTAVLSVIDQTISAPLDHNGGSAIELYIQNLTPERLGLKDLSGNYNIDVSTIAGSQEALSLVDSAINVVSAEAGRVGAVVNALGYQADALMDQSIYSQAAHDNHVMADIDEETIEYNLNRVRMENATAMVAQANLMPSRVMVLLGLQPSS